MSRVKTAPTLLCPVSRMVQPQVASSGELVAPSAQALSQHLSRVQYTADGTNAASTITGEELVKGSCEIHTGAGAYAVTFANASVLDAYLLTQGISPAVGQAWTIFVANTGAGAKTIAQSADATVKIQNASVAIAINQCALLRVVRVALSGATQYQVFSVKGVV